MTVGVPSAILAAVVSLTIGIAILFRRPRRSLYGYFAAFAFAVTLWHVLCVASRLAGVTLSLPQGVAALLIAPSALLFFRELLRLDDGLGRTVLLTVGAVGVGLLALSLAPWWVWSLPLKIAVVSYVAATLAVVLQAIRRRLRETSAIHDGRRLRFLLYGGGVTLLLACGEFIRGTGVPATFGHVAVTVFIYFLYQSIISRRLIDTADLLGKGAVLALLTMVLATVYGLLVRWVGADQPSLWLFNTLVASFVILIIYDPIRPWVEETTSKLLFRERYQLRQAARLLQWQLRTIIAVDDMCRRTVDALHANGQTNVALFLWRDDSRAYSLADFRGESPPHQRLPPSLLRDLERHRRPIHVEQLRDRRDELAGPIDADTHATKRREVGRVDDALSDMRSFHATLMLPMRAADRLVGILALGQDGVAPPYSTEDIAILLSVADACAVVLENSAEVERIKQRDRLAAIGEMATGMAHEIRNPLGAIKGAAQCLDPEVLPEEAVEFVEVIIEEVDRLNGVVAQFLEYARPYGGDPQPIQVNEVIARTLKLLDPNSVAPTAIPQNINLERNLAHDLPQVSIDPQQLRQVLLNLTLNAVQSMSDGGTVHISTTLTHQQQSSPDRPDSSHPTGAAQHGDDNNSASPNNAAEAADNSAENPENEPKAAGALGVVIHIRDEGEGIQPSDMSHIFVPFFTTKNKGTGLGLPISQRIIENHGGRLEVHSTPGSGTTFSIILPALVRASTAANTTTMPELSSPAQEVAADA